MSTSNTELPKKIPKKRGRKPKPKTAEDLLPKIPKKRGRKPKIRNVSTTNRVVGITEETENIIMHIPIQERILMHAGQDIEDAHLIYRPRVEDPRPYDPNESGQKSVLLNPSKSNSSNFFQLPSDEKKHTDIYNIEAKSLNESNPSIKSIKSTKSTTAENKALITVSLGLIDLVGINTSEQWPSSTTISCWWCCHPFENMPLGLPQKRIQDRFLVTGCFCSFNCTLAYNINLNDFKVSERTSLLKFLFRALYPDIDDNFSPAPRKEVLNKFGGNLEVDDYRLNFEIPSKEVRILMPPIISMPPQIEEIRLKKKIPIGRSKAKKKFVPLDMKEVERALNNIKHIVKPKAKNSLEITMGLMQK